MFFSALQSFMALKAILPISVFMFYFDWPLIGSDNINQFTIYGLIVVMVGKLLSLSAKFRIRYKKVFLSNLTQD